MLGQPIVDADPAGGRLPAAPARSREGATATDLVLTVHQMLRKKGVVGKFVEFFGPGLAQLLARRPRDDRQHGARVRRHHRLLPGRRRDARATCASPAATTSRSRWSRPTARRRACSARRRRPSPSSPTRSSSTSAPSSRASPGPKRPQDRVPLARREGVVARRRCAELPRRASRRRRDEPCRSSMRRRSAASSSTASVVIAAITSCTNTSNPSVMLAAGLLAQEGRRARPARRSRG